MTDDASDREVYGERLVVNTGRRGELNRVEGRIMEALDRCGFDAHACFAVRTALEEALSNALLHGNRNDPAKALTIEFAVAPSAVAITVEDEGAGFEPASVPDPTRPENVDIPSGRGIMLMRAYMTEVEFDPPGNRVRMTYRR
ncbi:MAG: ATP-binding protein [Planctomycetota bacterium]|jgi:serine/threonine-protein kinase RsbW